ncbi:uncharacterized protein LOC135210244 isoform X1 [Macrobrachium nipponense]|uniref:uncharacterized protein LOC135210244 isoform X1 n=1 Tax=Macrobrachium nipponense TaxID=159736 RepID=UPI0030C81B54
MVSGTGSCDIRGSPRMSNKSKMTLLLLMHILLVGGASLTQATPTTRSTPAAVEAQRPNNVGLPHGEHQLGRDGLAEKRLQAMYADGKNSAEGGLEPTRSVDDDDSAEPLPLDPSIKNVVKRSANGVDGYMASVGYDPMSTWAKRDTYDPGYEAYMQSVHYDPMMAWGKRQIKKNDPGYDAYMQTIGYDPTMAWGKRDTYDPYLQTVGYDPMSFYAKKTVKRSSETPSYYSDNFLGGNMKSQDPYMDLYIPNHYMHNFKRSINPYLLTLASNDWKRAPNDMGAQGFHEGIFTHNFGDFSPVKRGKREAVQSSAPVEEKRRPEMTSSGFYGDTFSGGFGDFSTMKKRRLGMGASGFHGDTFNQGFGDFSTMKKRRLGMGASGFHGDTFNQGFGDFSTMKKRRLGMGASGFYGDTFNQGFGDFSTMKKRRLGMGASGFHGDTFNQGFGDFSTMKKRRLGMDASGFYGDTFNQGFGDFSTMKKRRLGMGASGFHGDTFNQGFGDFSTMKKRRLGMGASGFYGDTFNQGFGDFSTMKKRRPEMDSSGFYGDTFNGGFGDFYTMKRSLEEHPNLDDSGFYGESVSEELTDFSPEKKSDFEETQLHEAEKEKESTRRKRDVYQMHQANKRRPDMDASGFHGDTFSGGFGDFYTMRKRLSDEELLLHQQREEEGRPKRNIEGDESLEVEMKPPLESDLSIRNRRSIQEATANSDYADADVTEESQDIYKRSIDGSNPFYEGFEDLNTMNGWR